MEGLEKLKRGDSSDKEDTGRIGRIFRVEEGGMKGSISFVKDPCV